MATIDQILDKVNRHRIESLHLDPGRIARLRRDGQWFKGTQAPLSAETLRLMIREVAPAHLDLDDAAWSFEYERGEGRFRFRPGDLAAGSVIVEPLSGPSHPAAQREIRAIEPLLLEMVAQGGSDLHLSSRQVPRLRVDGELRPMRGHFAPQPDALQAALLDLAPERNREQFLRHRDTDFAIEIAGKGRFRANYFRDRHGIAAVFRLIPLDILGADSLGLPEPVRRTSELSNGLVLVTGPTGSGKSTTLAAILDLINQERADHIITIEDPVEFVHRSKRCLVHQREVGVHTDTFASALRAALREDPDIVLVGEMRDLETTAIAIETAETGHLVFGTLHTTSAPATIERLIDQFPEGRQSQIRLMLASSLKAVVSQVLLKRIGGGRVAAFEVMLINPAIANLIREGKVFQIPSAMQTGRGQGMRSLDEALLQLVTDDVVEAEEAYFKANDKNDFAARLRRADVDVSFLDRDAEPSPAEDERPRLRRAV